jgi:hypothetical protein
VRVVRLANLEEALKLLNLFDIHRFPEFFENVPALKQNLLGTSLC